MKDPKTFAFIKRKDNRIEKFQFPQLYGLFPRLKRKEICKIELENRFATGWKKNKQNESNLLGSVIQRITFNDAEVIERKIQCRLDDSHKDVPLHFNLEVSTKSKMIRKDKKHHREIKLNHSPFDFDNLECTWIGIFYPGRQCIQPILFPHNKKAEKYLKKTEEFMKNKKWTDAEMKKLSQELVKLYKEMNQTK